MDANTANLHNLLCEGGYTPTVFHGDAFRLETRTPSHQFITIVATLLSKDNFIALTARDFFDDSLARGIIDFTRCNTSLDHQQMIQVTEGFSCPDYSFDSVALLNPLCHRLFQAKNLGLHSKVFEVFPTFRCEFVGNESCEIIDHIRHHLICTLDWHRQISPRASAKIVNFATRVKTRDDDRALLRVDYLLHELSCLVNDGRSYIAVENYRTENCIFRAKTDAFVVAALQLAGDLELLKNQLRDWIMVFLTQGLHKAMDHTERPM